MDARLLYNSLVDEISADEAALSEKKELARLLKKRFDAERVTVALSSVIPSSTDTPSAAIRHDDAPLPARRSMSGKTLARLVEDVLPDLSGREFVVGDVADAMRASGAVLPDKPNGNISTVLKRLQEAGKLVRSFTGGGNVPHKYRLATIAASAKAEEEAIA